MASVIPRLGIVCDSLRRVGVLLLCVAVIALGVQFSDPVEAEASLPLLAGSVAGFVLLSSALSYAGSPNFKAAVDDIGVSVRQGIVAQKLYEVFMQTHGMQSAGVYASTLSSYQGMKAVVAYYKARGRLAELNSVAANATVSGGWAGLDLKPAVQSFGVLGSTVAAKLYRAPSYGSGENASASPSFVFNTSGHFTPATGKTWGSGDSRDIKLPGAHGASQWHRFARLPFQLSNNGNYTTLAPLILPYGSPGIAASDLDIIWAAFHQQFARGTSTTATALDIWLRPFAEGGSVSEAGGLMLYGSEQPFAVRTGYVDTFIGPNGNPGFQMNITLQPNISGAKRPVVQANVLWYGDSTANNGLSLYDPVLASNSQVFTAAQVRQVIQWMDEAYPHWRLSGKEYLTEPRPLAFSPGVALPGTVSVHPDLVSSNTAVSNPAAQAYTPSTSATYSPPITVSAPPIPNINYGAWLVGVAAAIGAGATDLRSWGASLSDLPAGFGTLINGIVSGFALVLEAQAALLHWVAGFFDGMIEALIAAGKSVGSWFMGTWSYIWTGTTTAIGSMSTAVTGALSSTLTAIQTGWASWDAWVVGWADPIIEAIGGIMVGQIDWPELNLTMFDDLLASVRDELDRLFWPFTIWESYNE